MTETQPPVDFDARPPMPVNEYAETVQRVNVGYDLVFTLAQCFLRALGRPDLSLLVIGAGGGAEIERFLPGNPGWHITGVDPSRDMLALAGSVTERLGLGERVTLVEGSVQALPPDARFDAATCLFVLHFLPDDAKLALLQGTKQRLAPGAPLLAVAGVRPEQEGLQDEFLGAWQQYGEMMGMPADRMADVIQGLLAQMTRPGVMSADSYVRLMHQAGFAQVAPFFAALGGMVGWIAR